MTATATRPEAPPIAPVAVPREKAGGRVLAGLGMGIASGALATFAFEPFGLWPLIFVAFVPMVVGAHWVAPPKWGKVVLGLGFGSYIAGQLSVGLAQDFVAIVFQLMPLYFAVIFTLVCWRSRAFHARTEWRWLPLTTPLAWVAVDFLRAGGSSVFSSLGGTWANPVYALYRLPTFLQPISVFGIFGLEMLILAINFTVAALMIRALAGMPMPRVAPIAVAGALVGWTVLGFALMDSPSANEPIVRVAAVQPGTDGDAPREVRDQHIDRAFVQTRKAAAEGAQLVVWNEAGIDFDIRREQTERFRQLAVETRAYIVVGMGFDDEQGRHHNEAIVVFPDGHFGEPFGKDHPGTFAGDYSDTQGTYPINEATFGPFGTVICYDMDFTDTARKMTRKGARLIAAPSNDVDAIAETHYTHLIFRAIENRVPTIKGDSGYDSAIIDQWGRLLDVTTNPSGQGQRTLVAAVTLGSRKSPFVSFGDWFGMLAVVGTIGCVVVSRVGTLRDRRRR